MNRLLIISIAFVILHFVHGKDDEREVKTFYRKFIAPPTQQALPEPIPVENLTDPIIFNPNARASLDYNVAPAQYGPTDYQIPSQQQHTSPLIPQQSMKMMKSLAWKASDLKRGGDWEQSKQYDVIPSYGYPGPSYPGWPPTGIPVSTDLVPQEEGLYSKDWIKKWVPESVRNWLSQKLKLEVEYRTIANTLLKLLVFKKVVKVILIVVIFFILPKLKQIQHHFTHTTSTTSTEDNRHDYQPHLPSIHDLLHQHLHSHKRHKRRPHHKHKPKPHHYHNKPTTETSSTTSGTGSFNVNCTHGWTEEIDGETRCDESGSCEDESERAPATIDLSNGYSNNREFKNENWKRQAVDAESSRTFSNIAAVLFKAVTSKEVMCQERESTYCSLLDIFHQVNRVHGARA